MKTQKNNLPPFILSHPAGPALLEAMLLMGINIDRLGADTWTPRPPDDVIASVSDHVMGDAVIDSVHDPPIIWFSTITNQIQA